MRLSIAISTHAAQFEALAYKGELASKLGEIAELGFDGVELAVRDPRLVQAAALDDLTTRRGLSVSAVSTGQAFSEEGLSLVSASSATRTAAVERLMSHLPLAERLNAIIIVGLLGTATLDGQPVEEAIEQLADSLSRFAVVAAAQGVRVALEPINRYESAMIRTVPEALGFIDQLGAENVGILLDTFHMNIEEISIADSIMESRDRIYHVHLADSNRHYPGAGHIDFRVVLDSLGAAGYNGYLSGEFLPLPDGKIAAQRFIEHIRLLRAP
jgi:sugar phosphate isomerase/epimerase